MKMKKVFKLVKSSEITTCAKDDNICIDWNKCLFCQEDTNEKLTCPADFANRFQAAGYRSVVQNLSAFNDLGCLPSTINLTQMDNGDGLEKTFLDKKAKFHKKCSLKFNQNELKRTSKRKMSVTDDSSSSGATGKFTRQKVTHSDAATVEICFFCEKPASDALPLHQAATFGLDSRVRQCANNLQDERLIAKLSEGDLIATEANYHVQCLVSLYNRDRANRPTTSNEECNSNFAQSTAFAELISYMQAVLEDESVAPVFQLSVLKKLYTDRVKQLGEDFPAVHSTRFKNKILSYLPEMEAHTEGRDVLLVSNDDIGKSLKRSCNLDGDSEAVFLSRAANIVRRDILNMKSSSFSGSFNEDCQEKSVPQTLLMLVTMIMYGVNIKNQENYLSQSALSVSQLISYNSCVRRRQPSMKTRHIDQHETPLPLFLGTMIHSRTRSRDLVDTLYRLGLSVSYDRVLSLSADLGNSVISHFENVGTVCPPKLNIGVFTTSAVDNIDHDPTSTSAHGSFHGTGISLFQHPDNENRGTEQICAPISKSGKKVKKLPESYTLVPAVSALKAPPVPEISSLLQPGCSLMSEAVTDEYRWCDHIGTYVTTDNVENSDQDLHVSWAAYHSTRTAPAETNNNQSHTAVSALLPLFPDDSKSVAMIRHSMEVVKKAVAVLNPGQIPVIACDQPLFKLAKNIQWTWPETYGEDLLVTMLGGLHIKMTLYKALGNMLDGSGWTSALVQADVATPGTADSFLKATHVKRTARAHQLTACTLYKLLRESYEKYQVSTEYNDVVPFEDWFKRRAEDSSQFYFWQLVLETELSVLVWDRAVHEGNFLLYVEALTQLEWLFHALDHYNYARAVSIHLRDMMVLPDKHPEVFAAFCKGKFTVNKTTRPFSRMALDESHEQNNACVKGDGGVVGLTENPSALLRWMVSGPELARVVAEFLSGLDKKESLSHPHHHEDKPGTQALFLKNMKSLHLTINNMGNPFSDTSGDLLVLDTRQVLDAAVVNSVRSMKQLGENQRNEFFKNRLVDRTLALDDRIPRNNLPLFRSRPEKERPRTQEQLQSMKRDCSLFSTLYIASQIRGTDLEDFFQHENQCFPPSLSDCGRIRLGKKADLLQCLEDLVPECDDSDSITSGMDMVIIDGAAIANAIKPTTSETFNDYAHEFMNYIRRQFTGSVHRVDVVFDVYKPGSLKAPTRKKRGKGVRIRVEGNKKLPGNWQQFLREDGNKTELFNLLSERVKEEHFPGIVVMTHDEELRCSETVDTESLSPSTHEEADTRILLHAADGAKQGCKRILLRTVDTDVIVLAVSLANKIGCEQLCAAFGMGKAFRILDITCMAQTLGDVKCSALPAFHALTGCDTTSCFSGIGKRTAWSAWNAFPDVTPGLCALTQTPALTDIRQQVPVIERFVVLMYDRGSSEDNVNMARQVLFTQKCRSIEHIPPTKDALHQHILRVGYQAGHVWGQSLLKAPQLPCPAEFGWTRKNDSADWDVMWMNLPPAGSACRAIIRCACFKGCRGRCKCAKETFLVHYFASAVAVIAKTDTLYQHNN